MAIRRRCGFTLIELMIAMVIVAIIVAIAYPSYVEQVRKSRRAEAKAVLLEDAQFMERTYTTTGQYDKDSAGNAVTRCSLPEQYTPASANIAGSSNCGSFNGAGAYYKILFPSNPPDPADPSSTLSSNPGCGGVCTRSPAGQHPTSRQMRHSHNRQRRQQRLFEVQQHDDLPGNVLAVSGVTAGRWGHVGKLSGITRYLQ